MNEYREHGFVNRNDYLNYLVVEYGEIVFAIAEVLGSDEDFDGLVNILQSYENKKGGM